MLAGILSPSSVSLLRTLWIMMMLTMKELTVHGMMVCNLMMIIYVLVILKNLCLKAHLVQSLAHSVGSLLLKKIFIFSTPLASKVRCSISVLHCCLAPCKSGPNYGPSTEPKIYIVKSARTPIPTSNGHISETKRRILDPLVPKFFFFRGLSPTLS